jgi:C4-dicarboxylate-specific signal transduction histidine kinase
MTGNEQKRPTSMPGHSTRVFRMTGRRSGRRGLRWNVLTTRAITAAIAHELRQPLAAIAINAGAGLEWLEASRPRIDRARRSLLRVLRETNRAAHIISRIKALATRGTVTGRRRLSINAIVRRTVAAIDWAFRAAGAQLTLQLDDSIPPVRGDAVQLQQLVHNLVTNAVDATAGLTRKPKRVEIVTRCGAGDTVVVTVRDSGRAIRAAALARAFEPFHTTKPQGMGLGLPICRAIVEAHGGRLWATPNRGGGAAFHFSLPGTGHRGADATREHGLRRR